MTRSIRPLALGAAFLALFLTTAAVIAPNVGTVAKKPVVTVYKDPGCGCCKIWVQHLIKNGYDVDARDTPDMAAIKEQLGVPSRVRACHTAVVGGYLIEGHVPAADIDRLLKEKPNVAGLAVPGMPMGSPGMDGAGISGHYQVLAFDKAGATTIYAKH